MLLDNKENRLFIKELKNILIMISKYGTKRKIKSEFEIFIVNIDGRYHPVGLYYNETNPMGDMFPAPAVYCHSTDMDAIPDKVLNTNVYEDILEFKSSINKETTVDIGGDNFTLSNIEHKEVKKNHRLKTLKSLDSISSIVEPKNIVELSDSELDNIKNNIYIKGSVDIDDKIDGGYINIPALSLPSNITKLGYCTTITDLKKAKIKSVCLKRSNKNTISYVFYCFIVIE